MSAEPDELHDEAVDPSIEESEVVYSGRVWDIRSDRFRYGDAVLERQYVDHPGAVAIVAVDAQGRVLLIQQYRHPIRTRDWEVPAGLRDLAGEAPLQTAQRELAEEADLVASRWDPLVAPYTTPGGSDEVIHMFLARELAAAPRAHARTEEEADIRVEWMPLQDAVTAVLAGRMRNAILGLGILAAAETLRREES